LLSFVLVSSPSSAPLCWLSSCYSVVWFPVWLRCSFGSYSKINFSQLQIQSMIWTSTLQIRKHEHSDDFNFFILFVGILPFYAINLDDVGLFTDSCFLFLAMLDLYLHILYSIDYWDEWILLFLVKINKLSFSNFYHN
jgi:hypothetical protein